MLIPMRMDERMDMRSSLWIYAPCAHIHARQNRWAWIYALCTANPYAHGFLPDAKFKNDGDDDGDEDADATTMIRLLRGVKT